MSSHKAKIVYADNAATTRLDPMVLEAMLPFLRDEFGNASQRYSFSRPARKALNEARGIVAACINAKPEEIIFTSGGTESDNWAIKGTVFPHFEGSRVLVSAIEHHAVLGACRSIEKLGARIEVLPVSEEGILEPQTLEHELSSEASLVSVMLSNNEIGTIEPVAELASIAHKHGSLFHTDAVQSLGHIAVDVVDLGIDLLSASAHKFNGPKGVGFLYAKSGTDISSWHDGGSQEFGNRAGTENIAGIVGLAKALELKCASIEHTSQYISNLEAALLSELAVRGICPRQNGALNHTPGTLSLSFAGDDGERILHRLDLMGIYASTGSACNAGSAKISHVLKAIGLDDEIARGTVRFSLGADNSMDDIIIIANALERILSD